MLRSKGIHSFRQREHQAIRELSCMFLAKLSREKRWEYGAAAFTTGKHIPLEFTGPADDMTLGSGRGICIEGLLWASSNVQHGPLHGQSRHAHRQHGMETINDWIEAELFMDFHVTGTANVERTIDDYTIFCNEQHPACSLSHLNPTQFRKQFTPAYHY